MVQSQGDHATSSKAPHEPPAGTAVAAHCVNARKAYGSGSTLVVALDDINVWIEDGLFTAIMGPSGSGKSTLMHCMAGLDTLTSGQTYLGDVELGSLNDKELTLLRRERVGFVFQSFNLVPTLNAHENITLPLALAGRKPDREWYDAVIATTGLGDRLKHRPGELSGGQQQRVAVARALVSRPDIIFADEPTGNLDTRSGGEILGFMERAVRDLGQTIVMVTHDPAGAAHANRALFLVDGQISRVIDEPSSDDLLDEMRHLGD